VFFINVISNDFVQENLSFLQKIMLENFIRPMRKTVHLLLFNLRPDVFEKMPRVVIRVSNDNLDPSRRKQASSANSVCLISVSFTFKREIFSFVFIYNANNSIQIINMYGDSGQPCLTPFSMLKYSEK
jgi:hypothetical protein